MRKTRIIWMFQKKIVPLHSLSKRKSRIDPLAQLVEHNTFNVGVLGSNPKRVTILIPKSLILNYLGIFRVQNVSQTCHNNPRNHLKTLQNTLFCVTLPKTLICLQKVFSPLCDMIGIQSVT
jgi:hypothetical protein